MCHPGSREGIRNRVSHTCRSSFRPNARSKIGNGKEGSVRYSIGSPNLFPQQFSNEKMEYEKEKFSIVPLDYRDFFFWSSILSGNKRGLISRQKSFPFVYLVASSPSFLFFTPAIIHFPQPLDDVSFGSFPFFSTLSPSIVENLTRIPHCKV